MKGGWSRKKPVNKSRIKPNRETQTTKTGSDSDITVNPLSIKVCLQQVQCSMKISRTHHSVTQSWQKHSPGDVSYVFSAPTHVTCLLQWRILALFLKNLPLEAKKPIFVIQATPSTGIVAAPPLAMTSMHSPSSVAMVSTSLTVASVPSLMSILVYCSTSSSLIALVNSSTVLDGQSFSHFLCLRQCNHPQLGQYHP